MQRLSPDSLLKSVGASSESPSSLPTLQPGSIRVDGLMSETQDGARSWLAEKRTDEVDRALETSLRSSLNVELNVKREWRFPEGKAPYSVAIMTGVTAPSRANIDRAISRVEMALTPVSRQMAEEMIGQLTAATAMRSDSSEMNEVKLDLYVECLLRHPADVAIEAVRWFAMEPRAGTAWFPTLPEVEKRCRDLSNDRLSFLNGLRGWREPDPQVERVKGLEAEWRRLRLAASELENKIGPGPASDDGPRGERIAAWRTAEALAVAAREEWANARKALDDRA